MSSAVLLPASFAILLAGALLFTNAIEWFGSMVGLGQGAVGSLLAAVATGEGLARPRQLTGALVVQSTLPMAVGLAFTSWELDSYFVLAGCLALGGGLVAIVTLQVRRRFTWYAIALWGALYATFVVYVVSAA